MVYRLFGATPLPKPVMIYLVLPQYLKDYGWVSAQDFPLNLNNSSTRHLWTNTNFIRHRSIFTRPIDCSTVYPDDRASSGACWDYEAFSMSRDTFYEQFMNSWSKYCHKLRWTWIIIIKSDHNFAPVTTAWAVVACAKLRPDSIIICQVKVTHVLMRFE